ncbi:hypothetical protein BDR07DRAFT_1387002 [Suillus spraguei]|nr:hypothetical protein BDR07DRAFT_1387002 [Suillus spraguei]
MEQSSTALQKVPSNSTTSACVDNSKDSAKSYRKVKEKREGSGTTTSDPGQGRPLKRARSDCGITQKHEDFYILDGNTVVEVDGVLFKLHRSRLVIKSSFFAQLLEHNSKDMTVYHLGNITTADDLVALLKFDDNPTEYYFQPPPFSVLAPILRAATALRFETYRVWAAGVLGQTWSENAAEIIALARSCNVNNGVKRALYELSRTRWIGLNGNDVIEQLGLEQIDHADRKCVELIRELSVTTWSEIAMRIGTSSCKYQGNFSRKKGKSSVLQATWDKRVHDSGLYTKFMFDPVCEDWCTDCIQSKQATWKKRQHKLWSDIDKWIPGHE